MVESLMIEEVEVDPIDLQGMTPLHLACAQGHYQVAIQLLNGGADINHQDKRGETCIFAAKRSGSRRLQNYLLEQGVDVNIPNFEGKTVNEIESQSIDKSALTISSEQDETKQSESEDKANENQTNSFERLALDNLNSKETDHVQNQPAEDYEQESDNDSAKSQGEVIKGQNMSYFAQPSPQQAQIKKVAKKTLEVARPPRQRNRKKLRNKYCLVRMDLNGVAHAITNGSALAFKLSNPLLAKKIEDPDKHMPYPIPTPSDILLQSKEVTNETQSLTISGQEKPLPDLFNSRYHWTGTAERLLRDIKKPMSKTLNKKRLVKSGSSQKKDTSRSPALLFFSRMFTSANYNLGNQAGIMLSKKDAESTLQPRLSIRIGLYPNVVRPAQLDKLISKADRIGKSGKGGDLRDHVHSDLIDELEGVADAKRGGTQPELRPAIETLLHIPDLVCVFKGPSSLHTIESKLKYNCYKSFKHFHEEVLAVFEGWLAYCGIWNDVGVLAYKAMKYWTLLVGQEIEKASVQEHKNAARAPSRFHLNQLPDLPRSALASRLRNNRGHRSPYLPPISALSSTAQFEETIDPSIRELIEGPSRLPPPQVLSSRAAKSIQYSSPSSFGFPADVAGRLLGQPDGQIRNELEYQASPMFSRHLAFPPQCYGSHGYLQGASSFSGLSRYGFTNNRYPNGPGEAPQTSYAVQENASSLARLNAQTVTAGGASTTPSQPRGTSSSAQAHLPSYRAPSILAKSGPVVFRPTDTPQGEDASDESFDFALNHDSD